MPLKTDDAGGTIFSCTHTSLRRAARHLTQIYDDALAPSGFTSSQAQIVTLIDQATSQGEGPTINDLARQLGVQVSALSHAFRPLTRDGLVDLRPDARDGRVKRAVLTAEGKARTDQMYALWGELSARMETMLGKGVNDQLRDLADQVSALDAAAVIDR